MRHKELGPRAFLTSAVVAFSLHVGSGNETSRFHVPEQHVLQDDISSISLGIPEGQNIIIEKNLEKAEVESTEESVVIREHNIKAQRISIPSLEMHDILIEAKFLVEDGRGNKTYSTPDSGLATNGENMDIFSNKIFIYGHSRFQNKKQLFNSLEDIKKGDEVLVDGKYRDTGKDTGSLRFSVEKILIADRQAVADMIFNSEPPENTQVFLLTSFREEGSAPDQYLLDMEKIRESGVEFMIKDDLNDPSNYIFLLVVASFPNYEKALRE